MSIYPLPQTAARSITIPKQVKCGIRVFSFHCQNCLFRQVVSSPCCSKGVRTRLLRAWPPSATGRSGPQVAKELWDLAQRGDPSVFSDLFLCFESVSVLPVTVTRLEHGDCKKKAWSCSLKVYYGKIH